MVRRTTLVLAGILWLVSASTLVAQLKDRPGFKDPALFTRMPGYFLSNTDSFREEPFASYTFPVTEGNKLSRRAVEGRVLHYRYWFDKAQGTPPSLLQIIRNYQNAAKAIGGEVLHEARERTTIRIVKDNQEIWVDVQVLLGSYLLVILEKKGMEQNVVADAAALQGGLSQAGHVEVPGIFFDTAKSDVKPESEAALKEVVKMLQASPSLRVWVVGHTDSVGSAESNLTLSAARAAAVVKALTAMGIDPKRLAPHGAGPFAPVATNKTDEGRARNRRVELVEQS